VSISVFNPEFIAVPRFCHISGIKEKTLQIVGFAGFTAFFGIFENF
jgi:hypothetical protein